MTRSRNKDVTGLALRAAMLKVKNLGLVMSISAVAREAAVAPSTIHKVYPDLAEEIRAVIGRSTRQQRNKMQEALIISQKTSKELRLHVLQLESDLAKLASLNYGLKQRIELLEAEQRGKVVVLRADNPKR